MKQYINMKLGLCLLVGMAFVDVAPRMQRATANEPESRTPQAGATKTKSRERDAVAEKPAFGRVIERLIVHPGDSETHCVLDLDSGEFNVAPPDVHDLLRNPLDKATKSTRPVVPIARWAQSSGADLTLAMTSPDVSLILYEGLISPAGSFDTTGPEEVQNMATEAMQQREVDGKPKPPMWMFQRPGPPHGEDAFVFQTREGGIGLMQIVGSTEKPRSVKIRYKLLVAESAQPEERPSRQLRVIHLQHLESKDILKTLQQLKLLDENLAAAAPKTNLLVLRGDVFSIEEALCLIELLDSPPQSKNVGKPRAGNTEAESPAQQTDADPSFEWVHERVINHPADSKTDYFLDLDSGNFVTAPDAVFELLGSRFDGATKLGRRDETIKAWARDAGADLTVGFTSPDVTLSLYGGAICFPTLSFEEAKASDVMKAANIAAQERKKGGKTLPPLTMFHRHELDREGAFVFQTREGGIGLLQIVSSTEEPRSVKIRYKLLVAGTSDASSPTTDNFPPPYDSATDIPAKAATVTSTFALRNVYASTLAHDLKKQILQGRAGKGLRASADHRELTVSAPPDVMKRVQTFITVTDCPDAIERGPNEQYLQFTVMRTARSFFYACAIEDSEQAISNLLSLQVLAELKGDTKSKPFEDYQRSGVPDADWEASLRADWPGKKELMQRLVREWNRYPLQRIVENGGIAIGFGVKHSCSAWFEGAPKEFYYLTVEPGRAEPGAREVPYFFSSLPPWWNANLDEAALEPAAAPAAVTPAPPANDDSAASAPNGKDHDRRKADELLRFQETPPTPDDAATDERTIVVEGALLEINQPGSITVVISLGADDGVKSGDILTISRKGKRIGSLKIAKVERERSAATITAIGDVKALEVGDQITNRQPPAGPPPATRQPLQSSDAQRKEEVATGTLSGRFVYDGEPPVAKDIFPSFAKLDIDKPQKSGPDGRFSGVEAVYREYLKHRIRPTTTDQSLRVGKDKGLADVVIWVVSKDIPWSPPPEGQSPVTVQIKNASFSPRAIALTVDQPLIIENHDPVSQSVSGMFSRTANPAFNALLKAGSVESSRRLTLPAAEPFPAKLSLQYCPWTNGLLFVHSNPYVAISQEDGSFRIPNLPIGEWEFQAWHPRSGFISDWPGLRGPRKKRFFTQKITAGDNRLATIKLQPELFEVRSVVDKASLLGGWKVIANTMGGKAVDRVKFDGMRWIFGEGTLDIVPATINLAGAAEKPMPKSSYSVDSTQSPAHFNWTFGEGKTSVEIAGIYELKDDVLRICVPQHGEPRPTGFETKGQNWTTYEFKRDLKE